MLSIQKSYERQKYGTVPTQFKAQNSFKEEHYKLGTMNLFVAHRSIGKKV